MTVPVRAGAGLRLLRAVMFSAVCVTLSAAGHSLASGGAIPLWALIAGWGGVMCFAAPLAGRERSLPGIAAALLTGELGLHLLFSAGQWCGSPSPSSGSVNSGAVVALAQRLLCNDHLLGLTPQTAARIVRQAGIAPTSAAAYVTPAASPMPGMASDGGAPGAHTMAMSLAAMCSPSMLAGHLAAAVVLGWVLWRGESALWHMVRLSARTAAQTADRFVALLPLTAVLAAIRALALLTGVLEERLAAVRTRRADDGTGRPESVKLQHSVVRRGPPAVTLAA
ncbi:hypothetical protein NGB36_21830 [Streptomyces sp. RB6PN25]|uniref:Integral membrane protein n=1 Tax=Streptomyces humicola TaxID=2953240 RepID=A0ABT1PZR6_9ACTN|nr:hypothetical protein [Streptomyces humicola]MCQ4083173.1 hypothetical protein [Streptomyces humicola]